MSNSNALFFKQDNCYRSGTKCEFCNNFSFDKLEELGSKHPCFSGEKINTLEKYLINTYFICKKKIPSLKNMFELSVTLTSTIGSEATLLSEKEKMNFEKLINAIINTSVYNAYLLSSGPRSGKTVLLTKLMMNSIIIGFSKIEKIIPIYLDCSTIEESKSIADWFDDVLKRKASFNFHEIIENNEYKKIIVLDNIYLLNTKNVPKVKELAKWVEDFNANLFNTVFLIALEEGNLDNDIDSYFRHYKCAKLIIDDLSIDKVIDIIGNNSALTAENKQSIVQIIKKNETIPFWRMPYYLEKILENPDLIKSRNRTELIKNMLSYVISSDRIDLQKGIDFLSLIARNNNIKKDTDVIESVHIDYFKNLKLIKENKEGYYEFRESVLESYFLALYYYNKYKEDTNNLVSNLYNDAVIQNNKETINHLYNLINDKEVFINEVLKYNISHAAECVMSEKSENNIKDNVRNEIITKINSSELNNNLRKQYGEYLGLIGDTRLDTIDDSSVCFPKTKLVNGVNYALYPVTNYEFSKFIFDEGYSNLKYWECANQHGYFSIDLSEILLPNWMGIQARLKKSNENLIEFCKKHNFTSRQCACLYYFIEKMDREKIQDVLTKVYSKERMKKPMKWEDAFFDNPSYPVTGINYYEMLAYCKWLTEKSGGKKAYRLLRSDEWEKLADPSKPYVFGRIYNANYCNTLESEWGSIIPVGIIPQNKTNSGIYDLTGNIFEMTSTLYEENPNNPLMNRYIVKGGSWIQEQDRAQTSYRGQATACTRNIDIGFRICYDE